MVVLGDMNAYTVENADKINQRAVDTGYITEEIKDRINNSVQDIMVL
jgi:predicted RNA methylase